MKLNPDCMRAVMLEIEQQWEIGTEPNGYLYLGVVKLQQLYDALDKYSKEDIFYSLYNLEQAGYLDLVVSMAAGGVVLDCTVNHMTYDGHEFLNRIRDPKHWSVIKSGLSAVRNYSLDAINSIAGGITSAAITAFFEHNPL